VLGARASGAPSIWRGAEYRASDCRRIANRHLNACMCLTLIKPPEGAGKLSPEFLMCLASIIQPDGPAPKGQESLAQGLPWVTRKTRFALKGREERALSYIITRPCFRMVSTFDLPPLQGASLGPRFPGLKPWAEFSSPFGANSLTCPPTNVQTANPG
jgi:hypothetical protein